MTALSLTIDAFLAQLSTSLPWALAPAFVLREVSTSWLELMAVLLSLLMVVCTVYEKHWGWPLAALSSLLYFWLFWLNRLYGDAWLQIFFAVMALWGWWMWLRTAGNEVLHITRLNTRARLRIGGVSLLLWLGTGWWLRQHTDTDVPWWDAFPTAVSVVGQYLLAHKRLENWATWVLVNVVAAALFAWKGLWLTTLLYMVFIGMSVWGWRTWLQRLNEHSTERLKESSDETENASANKGLNTP